MSEASAVKKVVKALGNKRRLALALGISAQAVGQWTRIPVEHCLKVSELTGIPLHELRSDIYPRPSKGAKGKRPLEVAA